MSMTTGGTLNLIKPELTDDHKVTIGTDLPANFQKVDDVFTNLIESGVWTPTIVQGGEGVVTGEAEYYRIGKLVHLSAFIHITMTSVTSDQLQIGNLPFVCASIRNNMSIGYANLPDFAGYTLTISSGINLLGGQSRGTPAAYAGNKMGINNSYVLQFSGMYVCV